MPIDIEALDEVPEGSLKKIIKQFASVGANIVTAINDGKGTFSVEASFIDPGPQGSITRSGKMSTFGGPHDMGVGPGEGLALFDASDVGAAPAGLFLDSAPPGTTGLARRLNPAFNYLACRWDYSVTPRNFLRQNLVMVSANGKSIAAQPTDWGPNVATGRVADLSPGLAHALGLATNDNCNLVDSNSRNRGNSDPRSRACNRGRPRGYRCRDPSRRHNSHACRDDRIRQYDPLGG